MAAKKLPVEERVLKLLEDGLSDKEVAAKTGMNPTFVWSLRVTSGLKPVTPAQAKIARRNVEGARRRAAR